MIIFYFSFIFSNFISEKVHMEIVCVLKIQQQNYIFEFDKTLIRMCKCTNEIMTGAQTQSI